MTKYMCNYSKMFSTFFEKKRFNKFIYISIKLKIVINIDIEKITLIFLCLIFIKSFSVTSTKFACRS